MHRKKTIIHITNIPTPYRINFFNQLDIYLKKNNIQLLVLYCARKEPNRQWNIDIKNIHFKHIFLKGFSFNIYDLYVHINPFINLILIRLKPDILLNAGSWNMTSAILSSLQFRFSKTKLIFWSEGHFKSVRNSKGFIAFIRKRFLDLYDYYSVPNASSKKFIIKDCNAAESQIINLPNTIEENIFFNKEYKEEKKYKKNKKILITVASLENRKGFINLIDSIENLSIKIKKDLHLNIIGDGPLFSYIDKRLNLIGISFQLLGNLDANDVSLQLQKSDGFILASLIDPNPLSAIEALASGLPLLISNNCGNVNECIYLNKNGWSFDPNSPKEICAVITDWYNSSEEKLKEMGSLSKKVYKDNFQIDRICKEFSSKLISIINNENF